MQYLIRSYWTLRTSKGRAHSIVTSSNGRMEMPKNNPRGLLIHFLFSSRS